MRTKDYYPQLDALRAISVVLVMLSHYLVGGPWGDYGVRMFFVLSGFLITSIILTAKDNVLASRLSVGTAARNFFVRRSLRLFPVYYGALLIYLALAVLTAHEVGGIRNDWPYHFSYLTNVLVFVRGEWVGPLSPYWSLGVEEQFYLGWFWVVMLVPRRALPAVVVAFFFASVGFRALAYFAGKDHYADFLLPACIDTLAAGALLAIATHGRYANDFGRLRDWFATREALLLRAVPLICLVLVACSYGFDKDSLLRRLATNVLSSVVFAYLVYRCYVGVEGRYGRLLSTPAVIAIGKISYGIYVYHMLVLFIYRRYIALRVFESGDGTVLLLAQYAIDFAVPAALTLVLAQLSWRFLESPLSDSRGASFMPERGFRAHGRTTSGRLRHSGS